MSEADAAVDALAERCAEIARTLTNAGVPTQPLAEYVAARRVAIIFTKQSRLQTIDQVWRLGVVLLNADGQLYAAGTTTRAVDPGWPQYQAQSMEVRREYRAAAMRSQYAEGTTINLNATPITLTPKGIAESGGPLVLHNGEVRVRWSAHVDDSAALPVRSYLDERVELLLHPPEGA
ncbi:hypothetical protein ACSAGD_04705 [Paramicrobacterium sp. CJ85]|uniref:hypothetical protein n=1 Tax=Paramicrobacterium sp. CJ85 TaxID=3445355 RepID=UPI003F5E57A5